jgi:hypothetical protein
VDIIEGGAKLRQNITDSLQEMGVMMLSMEPNVVAVVTIKKEPKKKKNGYCESRSHVTRLIEILRNVSWDCGCGILPTVRSGNLFSIR